MYARLELGEETKHIRTLADRNSSLATFEFKNLAAGGHEVMLAIPKLMTLPSFNWTTCDTPDCATKSTHERERNKVAEAKIGFDAITTPWTFDPPNNLMSPNVQDCLKNVGISPKRKREIEIRASSLLSTLIPRHGSHHSSFPSGASLVLSGNSTTNNTSRP
jgi:hypothetical protein